MGTRRERPLHWEGWVLGEIDHRIGRDGYYGTYERLATALGRMGTTKDRPVHRERWTLGEIDDNIGKEGH